MPKVAGANVPLIPTIILITGGYMTWFAVHYWRDTAQVYPTGPLKAVLTGKGVPKPVREGSPSDPNASATGFAGLADSLSAAAGTVAAANGSAAGQAGAAVGNAAVPGSLGKLSHYSNDQIAQLWTSLGGDPNKTQWVQRIVTAESGGDPNSTSSNPDGGTNVGLFQLDTRGVGSGHTVEELKDPTLNTQITIMATRNGTDWADWGDSWTFAHGFKGKDNGTF